MAYMMSDRNGWYDVREDRYDVKAIADDFASGKSLNAFLDAIKVPPRQISATYTSDDPRKYYHYGVKFSKFNVTTEEHPLYSEDVTIYEYEGVVSNELGVAEVLEGKGNTHIVDTIKAIATMKADKDNYQTTEEAIKAAKEFLEKELVKECNRQIKLFQEGKITKREFDAYVKKYDAAREEYLPKIEENWSSQKELRDAMPKIIENKEQEMQRRAMLKANAKATFIKIVKSPVTLAKFIKDVLKSSKKLMREKAEERRLLREANSAAKRKAHIDKMIKTDEKIL